MKRVILGSRVSGDVGLWVSKPGRNALSSDVDDFLLSMSVENGLVVQAGYLASFVNTGRTNGGSPIYGAEVAHGLGYVPLFVSHTVGPFIVAGGKTSARVDATKLGFYYVHSSGVTWNYKVYYAILRSPLR